VNRRYAPAVVPRRGGHHGVRAGPGNRPARAIRRRIRGCACRQFPDDATARGLWLRAAIRAPRCWRRLPGRHRGDPRPLPVGRPRARDGPGTPGKVREAIDQNFRRCVRTCARAPTSGNWTASRNRRGGTSIATSACCGRATRGGLVLGVPRRPASRQHRAARRRRVAFDAIEFNPALSWIDVMNEMAFLVMDCESPATARRLRRG